MSFSTCAPKFPSVSDNSVADNTVADNADTDDVTFYYVLPNISAAFRSSETNRAYLFMNYDYVLLLDYKENKVLSKPTLVCDSDQYKSLRITTFEHDGVTGAFQSALHKDEAFLFSLNFCAVVNYLDHSVSQGPMPIITMFPFLKDTELRRGIDAGFGSKKDEPEAYIFRDKWYALINYGPQGKVIDHGLITEAFPSLRETIFESGIDAAFATHKDNEAYILKGRFCALIHFPAASTDGHKIADVKKILDTWPSLYGILPERKFDAFHYVYKDGPVMHIGSDSEYDSDSDSEPVSSMKQDK